MYIVNRSPYKTVAEHPWPIITEEEYAYSKNVAKMKHVANLGVET